MTRLYHPPALFIIVAASAFGVGCGDPGGAPGAEVDAVSAADATPWDSATAEHDTQASDVGAASDAPTAIDSAIDSSIDDADAAPPPTCDPRTFGAKGDGKTKDTAALQAAIDACAGKGGVVRVHDGSYLTGMLRLKSDLVFHIEASATIVGTQDDADYPTMTPKTINTQLKNCKKSLFYAESVKNLTLEGPGTIDGNGNTPKWIGPSTLHPEGTRPMIFFAVLGQHVIVRDVTLKNAAMWALVNMEVDDLHIDHVTIDSPLSGNRDGIDVVDCHHVVIENATITSEDDSICIKSGSRHGVDDVTVKNCHVVRSIVANALKFGTASYGSFSNVAFDSIVIDSADKAAMAVESVDGADVSNITFSNIAFKDVGSPVFVLLGDRGETPSGDVHKVGTIDGVHFTNVVGTDMRYHWASPISGLPTARLKNLSFDGVQITNRGGLAKVPSDPPEYAGQYPDPNLWGDLPAFGFFIRHADGVTLTKSTPLVAGSDARKAIEWRDVTGWTVK